jgi:2-phosphosulfolactate phosphatase
MHIKKLLGVESAAQAKGTTVIIDIFRASTTEAFLLGKGVTGIIPVSTIEEAWNLKRLNPEYILVGEKEGEKIEGFDFGNSPFEISKASNLYGKIAVHRSTRGTQALVRATQATEIIFGSFVCASAIINYLQKQQPPELTIIATMEISGAEDEVFADYLIARLTNEKTKSVKEIVDYLKTHPEAAKFLDPRIKEFSQEDFYLSLELDRFDFVPLMKNGKIVKHSS